jgi:hypothetical protein
MKTLFSFIIRSVVTTKEMSKRIITLFNTIAGQKGTLNGVKIKGGREGECWGRERERDRE